MRVSRLLMLGLWCITACSSESTVNTEPATLSVANPVATQFAVAGVPYTFDATASNSTVSNPRGVALTYAVTFAPADCGLSATGGLVTGIPLAIGTIVASLVASDATGNRVTHQFNIVVGRATPITVNAVNDVQGATVGQPFLYDATRSGTTFTSGSGAAMTYAVSFAPNANGLVAERGIVSGTPQQAMVITATITATDASGNSATNVFPIVSNRADLSAPVLPSALLAYSLASAPLPAHFSINGPGGGSATATDNTPANNAVTNAGATLGRVLFYDRRVSANDQLSCSSCHQQQFAFSDTARLSRGFAGGVTGRHSMGLANARFYQRGRFFWDERAATLEAQVLQPIQDTTEMGLTLTQLVAKLTVASFYAPLFQAAFGTAEITSDRVARALAQFVRSMVSGSATFDQAFGPSGQSNFAAVFTAQELQGQQVFNGVGGCGACHATVTFISDDIHNTGLDAVTTDVGAGGGRFKSPSLRNIAVRPPYMHDGRFATLEQVVEFYNSGVQNNPNLDNRLRGPGGGVKRLNLSASDKAALVAFMGTFTDRTFLTNSKFSSPFSR